MKEKRNAFVDGYRVVEEMVNDSKGKNFPEKQEGTIF